MYTLFLLLSLYAAYFPEEILIYHVKCVPEVLYITEYSHLDSKSFMDS